MIILLAEHVVSYLFNIYRNYEIKKYGYTNKYGVHQAPVESKLRVFEIILDIFIAVYIVVFHLTQMSSD